MMTNMKKEIVHTSGHSLFIYRESSELVSYLVPVIESYLSQDGLCLLFISPATAKFLEDTLESNNPVSLNRNRLKIFPAEAFDAPTFRCQLIESGSEHSCDILAVKEIMSDGDQNSLHRTEKIISQLLLTVSANFICLANESTLPAPILLYALSAHPWVTIRGEQCNNFYFSDAAGQGLDPAFIWQFRIDTLQLQSLLRQEVDSRMEATSREMQTRIQELSLLNSVISSATKTFDLNILVQETIPILADYLGMDAGGVFFPDDMELYGDLVWARTGAPYELKKGNTVPAPFMWARSHSAKKLLFLMDRLEPIRALTIKCLVSGRPQWCIDIESIELQNEINNNSGIFSFLITPIILREKTVGVLKFVGLAPVDIPTEKTELIRAAAYQIGIGVENARLYNEVLTAKGEWEETFNSISDMIFIRDSNFNILRYNRALAHAYSLKEREDIDRICYKLLFNREAPCEQCELQRENCNWEVRKNDNTVEEEIYRHSVFPLRDVSGAIVGAIHIMRDVTKEEQIRRQLYQADKMSALGQMIAGIAHEVNNPLTGILGFTDILKGLVLDKSQKENLEMIEREACRATQVMRNLLTFARDSSPRRESTDICKLLSECLDIRAHDLQMKNIQIIKEFNEVPPTIADPNQLRQVFMNIITNAEQAIKDYRDHGTIKVGVWKKNGGLEVRVCDDGPGISMEKTTRIFEPFYTTKDPGKGTGLGLAISHTIVAEHEGTIKVERSPIGGAAFVINLPLIAPPPGIPLALAEPALSSEKARVLVVDDEQSLRKIISIAMKKEGHEVFTSSSAFEALDLLKQEEVDLIILDMKMPGMGGIEFCGRLTPPLPSLLLISGDTVSEEIQTFAKETGADFLPKPFTIKEVTNAVRNLLQRSKQFLRR